MQALQRRDRGESNGAALEDQVRDAVQDIVARQARAGVTVVNDGEASKIGYSTRWAVSISRCRRAWGPVSYRDLDAVRADIANLQAAVGATEVQDAFMTAASPG